MKLSLVFLAFTVPLLAQPKPVSTKPTAPAIKSPDQPIPSFTVWQLRAGDTVESQVTPTQLNPAGYWLLVYIDPTSQPSKDLLAQIKTLATPIVPATTPQLDPTKLVIVASNATGAELSQFALSYPALASAAWTHDTKLAAAHLLNIQGTPHLFGMHEGTQRWQLAGVPASTTLTTWASYNRLPANTLTRTKHTRAEMLAKTKPTQSQGPTR